MEFIAFAVFSIALVTQLVFWLFIFRKLAVCDSEHQKSSSESTATIIICSKNAIQSLKQNLKAFLSQDFRDIEVLLVDDFSEDGTSDFIKSYQQKERYLMLHKVTKNSPGKKQAIKESIVKSKTDWLLFSDADCQPINDKWATKMISIAEKTGTKITLGYSPYTSDGSFLHKWIHFEAWITGVQYLSFSLSGFPYMGVGRNILYHNDILKPEVIDQHSNLISGDDDLTVNLLANSSNTSISIDPDTFVYSTPSPSWRAYFLQKKRHLSVAHRYKVIHQFLLSCYALSQVMFFLVFFVLILLGHFNQAVIGYLVRITLVIVVGLPLLKKLDAKFNLMEFVLFDFLQSIYYFIFSFVMLFPKKDKW